MQAVKPEDLNPDTAILGVDDDEDDDYEPDFHPSAEDTEQILNKLDKEPPEESLAVAPVVSLGPFIISAPLPLTPEQTSIVSASTAARVFSTMTSLGEPGPRKSGAGINRLAASTYDRDAWITLMTRLASRSAMGLDTSAQVKSELQISAPASMGSSIRETLYVYILEDFRRRIDVAVAWLCEEWYNDRIALKIGTACHVPQYDTWLMRIMDGILPYLDAKDKILTRFLSEVPALDKAVLGRVKQLCQDPAMVTLALTSLLYLVMMRPPARDMALDTVEEIWRDCKSPFTLTCQIILILTM